MGITDVSKSRDIWLSLFIACNYIFSQYLDFAVPGLCQEKKLCCNILFLPTPEGILVGLLRVHAQYPILPEVCIVTFSINSVPQGSAVRHSALALKSTWRSRVTKCC